MTSNRQTELTAVGCLPFEQAKPGFALPLFAHPENSTLLLVQEVDEVSGLICGFRLLDEPDLSIVAIANTAKAMVGSEVIHAFLDEDGNAHAGTSSQLAQILRQFATRNPDRRATNLQILELIGTEVEKKVARATMQQTIYGETGANAAADFYSGTLRSIMWNILVKDAQNSEIARRILRARPRLGASIENGAIVFDLDALPPEDRATINVKQLATRIASELELAPSGKALDNDSDQVRIDDVQDVQLKASEALRRINNSARQEERVAILIDAIVADRRVGLTTLLKYKRDRAKLANWAIAEIRAHFFAGEPGDHDLLTFFTPGQNEKIASFEVERFMASLVARLFTQTYPLSRGELLYYLAKHLGKWPQINEAITRSLNRTQSSAVDNWRPEIEALLKQDARNEVENLTHIS